MRDSSLSPSSRLGGAVISDRIVSALLEELRTGRYAQTDRLPAEVDLAAELGVSRTVIRDALSEMERAGYIVSQILKESDSFLSRMPWHSGHSTGRLPYNLLSAITRERSRCGSVSA